MQLDTNARSTQTMLGNALHMWDYDGVWAKPSENSFSIMREAFKTVYAEHLEEIGRRPPNIEKNMGRFDHLEWPTIFAETSGTTENKLVEVLCNHLHIPSRYRPALKAAFYVTRSEIIRDYNRDRGLKFFDQYRIFTDTIGLSQRIDRVFPDSMQAIVSGNPEASLWPRVPDPVRHACKFWVGGEHGQDRWRMVQIAMAEAEDRGWRPVYDQAGTVINAFYYDDTDRAIVDVARNPGSPIVIWLTRPSDGKDETSRHRKLHDTWVGPGPYYQESDYIKIWSFDRAVYGTDEVCFPRVHLVEDFDYPFLLSKKEGFAYRGILDPKAYTGFGIYDDLSEAHYEPDPETMAEIKKTAGDAIKLQRFLRENHLGSLENWLRRVDLTGRHSKERLS